MQDLYTSMENYLREEGRLAFRVRLDPSHPVYRGHFPGHPVLPGVCTLQIVKRCLARGTGQTFHYTTIRECKFLGMIVPAADTLLDIDIRLGENDGGTRKLTCTVTNDDKTVLKLRAEISEKP